MSADRSASVLARLLNRSRSTGENYNLLLREREHADRADP